MAQVSFTVGSVVVLCGMVGPRRMQSLFQWSPTVGAVSEKAVKLVAPGTSLYLWLPKSAIDEHGMLQDWASQKLHCSYISRKTCDGELVNHLGFMVG